VCCHTTSTCGKSKVQICLKLRTISVIVSIACQSLASQTSSLFIYGWRSMAAITTTCCCHSSCCPWCATCYDNFLIFQQGNAPHWARDTVQFFEQADKRRTFRTAVVNKLDNSIVCRTIWQEIFRFIKHDVL